MKKLKRENKGFSLVELIVVVLILGILAVAVTPQVMKWVGKSKISTDLDNANALKSSVQTALADWQGLGNNIPTDTNFSAKVHGSLNFTGGHDWTGTKNLSAVIDEVTAEDYPKTQYDTAGFTITIEKGTGKVTVTCGAQSVTP